MRQIDCTLVADGATDVALLPILNWVATQHSGGALVHCEWADLRHLPASQRALADRIRDAIRLFPCQLLFVHRDAEGQEPDWRYDEIRTAVQSVEEEAGQMPYVCVVPVRMQEAWLLLDEVAVRRASGNPHGRVDIGLPPSKTIEDLADPKAWLYQALSTASNLRGRRLKKFSPARQALLIADYMTDFSILRALPAFRRLESDVRTALAALSAGSTPSDGRGEV